jgi:histidinol phosphatase-like PHP family hydrolase
LPRQGEAAVIWAHPFISHHVWSYEAIKLPEVHATVPYIDGLELFNGTMLHLNRQQLLEVRYFQNLMRIGVEYGLTMTAGSDAHEADLLGRCYTTFPAAVDDAASFVSALKDRRVVPHYDHEFFGVRIPLG